MSNFLTQTNKTRTRKISLVKMRSNKRLRFFTSIGLNGYEKQVDFFVESLVVDGVKYTSNTLPLSNNQFNYNVKNKKLTFKTSGVNPEIVYVVPTFLHFFSNFPVILPWDLNLGDLVEYEPRLSDLGAVKNELDFENSGISLESDSNISLENNDGFFDSIFDTHIWENRPVEYYYWFENLLPSEAVLSYKGVVQDKSFTPKMVKFLVKDGFVALRDNLKLNLFDTGDGSYNDDLFLKPKRRIYGEVSRLKAEGIDKLKGSFTGSGTISGVQSTTSIVGVGTLFLKEICIGDTLKYLDAGGISRESSVQEILDDNNITLSEEIKGTFNLSSYEVFTDVYSKHFNRVFNIAGHKLVELSQPITNIVNNSTIEVGSIDGYEVGSLVEINNNLYTIIRAYDNTLVTNQNISPLPVASDIVYRVPCFKAYFGNLELIYKTDFTINNTTSNCNLIINENAEGRLTLPKITPFNLVFTNGSRVLTSVSTVDLSTVFSPRDLVKPNNISYANYYEVLVANEFEVILREAFSDITIDTTALHKKVNYISDDSLVTVDCLGIAGDAGNWIRYPSEIVEHILKKDARQIVDSASFLDSRSIAEFKMSMYFPDNIGSESPAIRDCITLVNKSVFGSLFYNSNYEFKYSILNSNKPEEIFKLTEHDVLSYDVITKNKIINRAKINYKPQTDLITGEIVFNSAKKTSDFVDSLVGYSKEGILDTYLFNESDSNIILNRYLFFNSLTNSVVKIKAKLNLVSLILNQPILLDLDRVYKRYAGSDSLKVGLVNMIERDESFCTVQINDLGGVLNRVPSISTNTLIDISTSSHDDIAKHGFIVDNLLEVPDNTETYLGSNLIG